MKHLKLFFALFAMLALGVGNAWGAETLETISYSNHKGKGTSSTGSAYTMNGDKFSITDSKFYCDATKTYAQFYANSTITITPNTGVTIKNIVITASSSSYNGFQSSGTFTSSIGSVTKTDGTHITWAGSATSEFTISHNKQIRWTAIEVTYEETTSSGGENPGEGGGGEDPDSGEETSATMTAGTNGTACTVNEKDGVKVGTSKKGGDMQITVPAGATMLHVYAAAWNGVTGLSLNITPTSNVTTTSITLTADAGIANNTPFTLSGNEADYLFDIPLQNITAETTLTFTSSAEKRFVVWGATYETAGSDEPGSEETVPSLTQEQFSWSATTATATLPNTFDDQPTLKNTENLAVSYSSSKDEVATIDANGNVTLVGKGETVISATAGDDETYKKTTVSYTLKVKSAPLAPIAGGVIDILNQDWTDVTGTNYTDVAAKTAENEGHSNAQYVAQCAGDKSSIQLRSNNNNSGVVSTISGGIVKRVEVEWQNETTAGRILQVYGSNTAYEAATDLYSDDKKGEFLGEITMGGDETVVDYSQWTGDYKYIGLRSKSGAMYLTTITITWLPINSKVTIDDAIQNGSISVSGATDLNAVAAGTVLTLDNTPEAGYKFVKYNVYKTDEPTTEIDVENSKFSMPEYDVTVSATFTSIKELDKIEVNTTNVKKTFWQGEAFSSNGLEVTAYYTDGTSAEVTPTNITGGNTANAGEITVTVSYTEGSNTKTTTYNITVKAIENNETTVYTVAQAREIIDAVGNTTVEVYVQGIVSKIVTAFNPTYGNISYDISADGLKTSDQLQAYRGFSYDGAWFTSADDIQVGDVVVVKGKLKIYNTTYELDEGNKLVSLVRSTEPKPTAATLPFEFDGNKDDIADVVGMSHEGLGSDYGSSPKLKFDTEGDNVIVHYNQQAGEFSFVLKQNGSNAGTFTVYESENGVDYTPVWTGGDMGGTNKYATITPTLAAASRYVKFEYTTKGNSTNYGLGSISIQKPDFRQEAGLAWSTESVTLNQGNATNIPTLSNPNTLTLNSCTTTNDAVATVTSTGIITLAGAIGTATITATFAGDATYKPAEVSCTITVVKEQIPTGTFALYSGEIVEGDYVIVYDNFAMNTTSSAAPRLQYQEVTPVENKLENPANQIVWHIAANSEYWTLYNDYDEVYAVSTGVKNQATTAAEVTDKAKWSISGTETYDIVNLDRENGSDPDNKYLRKNSDVGFACYKEATGGSLTLYRKQTSHTVTIAACANGSVSASVANGATVLSGEIITLSNAAESGYVLTSYDVYKTDDNTVKVTVTDGKFMMPAFDVTISATFIVQPVYTRATTDGKFGTICLPFGSTNYTGATFYEFVGSETGKVYLGSVTTLEAGVPYIFLATGTELAVYGNGTTAATAGNSNGLYGTFDNNTVVAADGNNYILFNNELCLCAAECYVNANRAYIKMNEVPTGVPTKMPGRRYIGMSVQGENEATGFENITAPEGQVIKAIVNGQLVIIRGGEMYNVQGQKL